MPKSSLLQKKALDALLDSMADGLDHDNYDELGAHRRGEPWLPEGKGTEFTSTQDAGEAVVIPAADLAQAPDLSTAEFFKEGEAPEFEMSASGMRRLGKNGHSPEWAEIDAILSPQDYSWMGLVSDGTEMWAHNNEQVVYDPATHTWQHKSHGKADAQGALPELAQMLRQTQAVTASRSCVACQSGECLAHDKLAGDVRSYGMGTPIGGTDNDYEGADDEEEMDTGEDTLDMTSSLEIDNDYDPDVEDAAFFAALDKEDDEAEGRARFWASIVDSYDLATVRRKFAHSDEISWFAKSARPTPQKMELLQKQFKVTPEQIEECIKIDPSPNQSDFVAWIAKYLSKDAFKLPEDGDRIKGQLEKFQKFKKSPQFLFNKDIQQYDPAKLFETITKAEAAGMSSEKEKKRDTVRQGSEVIVKEGSVTIYRVTEVKAANELGSGTNWCTATPGSNQARYYLKTGPLYIFFDSGSAVAQLHCESNQFMNRSDVCILESVTGGSSRTYGETVKNFLADPNLAKALQLLAAKEPRVTAWAKEHIADPEDIKKILGEASSKEIEENTQFEQDVAEYEEKMKEYAPLEEKYRKDREESEKAMQDYWERRERGELKPGEERPVHPRQPTAPRNPAQRSGWGDNSPLGKKYTMQVKNALATGQALPPEIENVLVESGMSVDLLLKYGSQFHPGKPWEPLGNAILREAKKDIKSRYGNVDRKKPMIDYAVKFLKGRWQEAEPLFLSKMFLLQDNMAAMQSALEYATRVVRGRWPEFEAQIQKAKPGMASGYGAAEYAINAVKQPWHKLEGIKRKRTTKRINAEECMIKGNPGEARKYAEAFYQGQRWEEFEVAALEANNLNALINYADGTLHARMPALEEKILSGTKDAQEEKGRRRHRSHTNLPLEYAKKVVKGRWPEYEAKMLEYVKTTQKESSGNTSYKPSTSEQHSYYRSGRLTTQVSSYIEEVVKGRWAEMEAILLARYQEQPERWAKNQNMLDGYLSTLNAVCKKKNEKPAVLDENGNEVDNDPDPQAQPMHTKPEDSRTLQPFTTFTQDQQCYWPEGEQRLITRDSGYEAILLEELKKKADDAANPPNAQAMSEKGVSLEDLRKMEKAPTDDENYRWQQRDKKPSWTTWNGYWIGAYGMEKIEAYVAFMWANKQDWPEGVEIMSIKEELDDVRGRLSYEKRKNWKRTPEQPKAEGATASMKKKFQSSLLNRKQALVEMHETPTMLPPRDDMRRHVDEQEQQAITDDVMDAPTNLRHQPDMIDPRINPDGMVASRKQADEAMDDEQGEYYLDQVRDAANEAKRHFMEDEYVQQLCNDFTPPKSMEQLWKLMKDEYTAEFYGTPYQRVKDHTDQPEPEGGWEGQRNDSQDNDTGTGRLASCPLCKSANVKTIEDKGYESHVVLAECVDCASYYSVSER